jgi:hypothetical protein
MNYQKDQKVFRLYCDRKQGRNVRKYSNMYIRNR